jgi:hypothetical protein
MPVPPQESAPSLSPRQSFGCQSPLPWVAGTDRTGILWALRQLQGFLPGVLFFPCALPHLEESRTGQQASRSPALRSHINPRENTDKAFQKVQLSQDNFRHDFGAGFTHRLAQHFHTATGFFHPSSTQGFQFRKCAHGISQRQTQTHSSGQECTRFPQDPTQAFRLPEINQSILTDGVPVPRTGVWVPMEEDPPPRFSSRLLFACARDDTCHPGNCMHTTACIPFARSFLCQELRINKNAHVFFWK